MKVIVTGACGMIGSNLCEALYKTGHDVTCFVQYNARGDFGWCPDYLKVVMGDVCDQDSLDVEVGRSEAEMIIHLAALIGIPYSYTAPRSYIETNVQGTLNVLQSAMAWDAKVIITSTSEVYGTAQHLPMTEDHPLSAQSPYAASKIAADQLALSFYRSFGTPVSILRPFNTYGPRQSARAVIPQIIQQLLQGDEVRLGNLDAERDFTFVDDTVAAFMAMMERHVAGSVVHVGTGTAISVRDLVAAIGAVMKKTPKIIEDVSRLRPEDSEVDKLLCDPSKARRTIKWEATTPLYDGLAKTVKWFKAQKKDYRGYVV